MTARGLLVEEFDLWMPDYAGATVTVYQLGTTTEAAIFGDEAMTLPLPNPQTLLSFTDDAGIQYGKFNGHVYAQGAYYLDINTVEQTGNRRPPLTDLVGVDATQATVVVTGGSSVRALGDRFADVIETLDYGAFVVTGGVGASPATNNATLSAAIGAAAAAGGGQVLIPAGAYEVTGLSIPANVVLGGRGKGVTTLICKTGGNCFTITGAHAGLRDLTLDGVNLVANSVGLTGFNIASFELTRAEVKRFVTGILFRGGSGHRYRDLDVENCTKNVRLLGDANAAGGNNGGPWTTLDWDGGSSTLATDTAIELSQVDQTVTHCRLRSVTIANNTGTVGGLLLYGAQFIDVVDCTFANNNLQNLWLRDSANTSLPAYQTVAVTIRGGLLSGGVMLFDGLAKNILLYGLDLQTVTIQLNIPTNPIIAVDCLETSTTLQGDTTKLERQTTRQRGGEVGFTTGATPVVAWQRALTPGQVVAVEAVVTAVYLNGLGFAAWKIVQAAHQLGASLNYNNQSANFTPGNTVQDSTHGAGGTAVITADADSGTTGTLTLIQVSGTFGDGDPLTEIPPGTGAAKVNGAITINATAMMGSMATSYSFLDAVATADAIAPTFDTNGQNLRLKVTGAANKTILWMVNVTETPSF